MSVPVALLLFGLLTAANAFFVISEYSLVTVDRALVEQSGNRGVMAALQSLSFQLSGAQLGITLAALISGYLAAPAFASFFPTPQGVAEVLAVIIATLLSTLFGELLGKNAALAHPYPLAKLTTPGMRGFSAVFAYPIRFLNASANGIVRSIGIEPQEELASARSPEELSMLAAISQKAGTLDASTAQMLQRMVRYGDQHASDAMTPRVDVEALEATASVADVLHRAHELGFSRFPLYTETIDDVVSVVSVTGALSVPPEERAERLAVTVGREPVLVPGTLNLNEVAERLRETDTRLAIVVDEYGGTDGILTLEDLAEELVGEIEDEFDVPEEPATTQHTDVLAPGAAMWSVNGQVHGDELLETTGFTMPDGPFETLGGFAMAQLGRVPVVGDAFTYRGWEFRVARVQKHRVDSVTITAPEPDPTDEEGAR